MPPRDETQPGWPAPAAFVDLERTDEAPAPAVDTAAPVVAEPRTLWRTKRKIPPPRPRGRPVAMLASEPRAVFGIADFQELRRMGLFDDDGRNPPPSWWAR
jgi:hypothetical protein